MLPSCFFNGTNYQPKPRALLIGTESTGLIKYMLNTVLSLNKITVMLNEGQINIYKASEQCSGEASPE